MASHGFTVLYDACVLFPAPLRDLLMRLALRDMFRARWTQSIHEEWIRNACNKRPHLNRANLDRVAELMNKAVLDCLVEDYEPLILGLTLPDENDCHVLAAAIKGQAEIIVTFNLKDFPPKCLAAFDIQAQHPDDFISHLIDLKPSEVLAACKQQRLTLRNPPKTVDDYLDALLRQGLPNTVAFLKDNSALI